MFSLWFIFSSLYLFAIRQKVIQNFSSFTPIQGGHNQQIQVKIYECRPQVHSTQIGASLYTLDLGEKP